MEEFYKDTCKMSNENFKKEQKCQMEILLY